MQDRVSLTPLVFLPVDLTVESEWKEFLGSVGGALADFFLKGPADSVSSGISGFLKFATSIKVEQTPGYLAWTLAITATAWSLDQSIPTATESREQLVAAFREAVNSSRETIKNGGISVPYDFFERPIAIDIYRFLLNSIIIKVKDKKTKSLIRYRMDALFGRAVYEIFSKSPQLYAPLINALNVPAAHVAAFDLSWSAYRAKLIYDFEIKPIFGQEEDRISLSQLYVPLRGTFQNTTLKHEIIDEFSEDLDIGPFHQEMVLIDEVLDEWLSENKSDWLRLIGGGPGSGKSTTLKALASRSAKLDDCRPLFIPLQYIDHNSDLRESINKYFTQTSDSAFSHPPLSRESVEDGAPLLLIFDGLDEIVAPGEAAKDVVGTFANRLHSLVSSISGNNSRKVKVIVSGRMPAFQAANRYLPTPRGGALEAYGFLPHPDAGTANKIWKQDQRVRWWRQYAALKRESPTVPEAFSNDRLESITHEPLLCYLLALAGYANQGWELAADNRNRIYSALIESIYDRGWGDGAIKRLGPGKTLSKNDFIKLMETIALAAWLGGDSRVASEENFDAALEILDTNSAWDSFTGDNGQDVTNLAMNFYLKSSEKSQRGFEFTHKSFGEYLSSRAILSVAEDISANVGRRTEHAMRDWMVATKTGEPTQELLNFLRDEVRLRMSDASDIDYFRKIINLKQKFQILAERVAEEGFPISSVETSWRVMEVQQASSECSVWMILNALSSSLFECGKLEECIIKIDWGDNDDLSRIINRSLANLESSIICDCFSHIDAAGQTFSHFRSNQLNLSHSIIDECVFIACSISGSFEHAMMNKARFYLCNLESVNFNKASIDGMILQSTSVRNASFEDVDCKEVFISPLSLAVLRTKSDDNIKDKFVLMVSEDEEMNTAYDFVTDRLVMMKDIPISTNNKLVGDMTVFN